MNALDAATVAELERTSSRAALAAARRLERWGVAPYDRVPAEDEAICADERCRSVFRPRRILHVYCSDGCGERSRQRAYYARHRERFRARARARWERRRAGVAAEGVA